MLTLNPAHKTFASNFTEIFIKIIKRDVFVYKDWL